MNAEVKNNEQVSGDLATLQTVLQALEATVKPLIRLGGFIGNADKGGPSGQGPFDRCAILLDVKSAISIGRAALAAASLGADCQECDRQATSWPGQEQDPEKSVLKTFEVLGFGYDASTHATDDRVLWVKAHSADEVRAAIAGTKAGFYDIIDGDDNIDFVLPGQAKALNAKLMEFEQHEQAHPGSEETSDPALMQPAWSNEHREAAHLEGWDIFDASGSVSGRWQIQHFDDASDIAGATQLDSDDDALRIVVDGSMPHHEAARQFIKAHNYQEWLVLERTRAGQPGQ